MHKHLLMSHLAFRRDTSQPQLVARFAEEVGTPERLELLALVTCADLAAVGPGVLNSWKVEVLFELYRRTLRMLTPDRGTGRGPRRDCPPSGARMLLAADERTDAWFERQLDALPEALSPGGRRRKCSKCCGDCGRSRRAAARPGRATCRKPTRSSSSAAIDQGVGPGHLLQHGRRAHQPRDANSLGRDEHAGRRPVAVALRGHDPDYPGEPPPERLAAVCDSLVASIDCDEPPTFRTVWGHEQHEANAALSNLPNEVRIDTQLSDECTIVEVFTIDRRGLLYRLARALHDLGLIIRFAKIGTYLDQVVDVFYVTERDGAKPQSDERLAEIRSRLFEVIGPAASDRRTTDVQEGAKGQRRRRINCSPRSETARSSQRAIRPYRALVVLRPISRDSHLWLHAVGITGLRSIRLKRALHLDSGRANNLHLCPFASLRAKVWAGVIRRPVPGRTRSTSSAGGRVRCGASLRRFGRAAPCRSIG